MVNGWRQGQVRVQIIVLGEDYRFYGETYFLVTNVSNCCVLPIPIPVLRLGPRSYPDMLNYMSSVIGPFKSLSWLLKFLSFSPLESGSSEQISKPFGRN